MSFKHLPFLLSLILLLASCGGGGGGSSDSAGSNSGNAQQGIRVIHAAIDFGPLEIFSLSGSVDKARFAEVSYHGRLDSGLQNINLAAAGSAANSYWSASVDLKDGQRKSVLAFGGYKEQDLRVAVIDDSSVVINDSFASVRFINGLAGATTAHFSIPNVVQSASAAPGSASVYVPVTPGTYDFLVDSEGVIIGKTTGNIEAGKAYSIAGQGVPGYLVSTNLLKD